MSGLLFAKAVALGVDILRILGNGSNLVLDRAADSVPVVGSLSELTPAYSNAQRRGNSPYFS